MRESVEWFNRVLTAAIQLYFRQDCEYTRLEEVSPPRDGRMEEVTGFPDITFGERVVVMLALMPHVCPQVLDIFFVQNKNFDCQYTEFGGWKSLSHGGFLPTGERRPRLSSPARTWSVERRWSASSDATTGSTATISSAWKVRAKANPF